ncbi:VOC family protein [Pedobacter sp.]|uniref:VOC family protein n=1 Tax=Pedobacter sp. TaxID=1411316 RepID=UPI003BAC0E78
MAVSINTYLTFSGNCREAMTFYHDCLGGELSFQTIAESPLAENLPGKIGDCILHSALVKDGLLIMGTDLVDEQGLIKGNSISMMLNCSTADEVRDYYQKLSTGGQATHPLVESFWGSLFGNLTDKFGNHWLLSYDRKG